ncbi:MAG: MBL fold metallo-hydrolase [Clostridia bacterium]|nr:MBL fold metallo-hydrolase [Clostridia bacterium]
MKKIIDGIYQIEVVLPEVGGLNLYFLEGDIPTLVDTGPVLPGIRKQIDLCLRQVGRQLGDLQRIIITHGHVDHYGLAEQLQEISGAEIIMSAPERQLLLDFQLGGEKDRLADGLTTWGVPVKLSQGILNYFDLLTSLGCHTKDIRTVADGVSLKAGQWNWQVHCCAGHSPAGLCFSNADGLIFSGDHILANISPNPGVDLTRERPFQGGLQEYIDSLKEMSHLPVKLCLPGHGPLVRDFQERIRNLLLEIAARRTRILALVGEQPKSIFRLGEELLATLGRKLTVSQLWLALKEVKSHLDLLEQEIQVQMVEIEGVNCYRLV